MTDTKTKIETYINKFPLIVEPCEYCANKKNDRYQEECSECCYFYASHFIYKIEECN